MTENILSKDIPNALSDQELTALLASRQDIATSLAEDLLAQIAQQTAKDSHSTSHKVTSLHSKDLLGNLNIDPFSSGVKPSPYSPTASQSPELLNESQGKHSKVSVKTEEKLSAYDKDRLSHSGSSDSYLNKWDELKVDTHMSKQSKQSLLSPSNVSINMSSSQIIATCKGIGKQLGKYCSIRTISYS